MIWLPRSHLEALREVEGVQVATTTPSINTFHLGGGTFRHLEEQVEQAFFVGAGNG